MRATLYALASVLSLSIAACGDDGGDGSGSTSSDETTATTTTSSTTTGTGESTTTGMQDTGTSGTTGGPVCHELENAAGSVMLRLLTLDPPGMLGGEPPPDGLYFVTEYSGYLGDTMIEDPGVFTKHTIEISGNTINSVEQYTESGRSETRNQIWTVSWNGDQAELTIDCPEGGGTVAYGYSNVAEDRFWFHEEAGPGDLPPRTKTFRLQ